MNNALSIAGKGKVVCNQIVRERDTVSVVRKAFESGVEVLIAVRVPKTTRKTNATPFLRDLMSLGFNQKTAAMLSGISQSYASKLLRR
jgi:hypothetical protein